MAGAYEAYGKRLAEGGDGTATRQKANTKDEDPHGLLNEGFRYRDLDTGVFITRDPLDFVDGPNVYTYVKQNPWSFFDPDGLEIGGGSGIPYILKGIRHVAGLFGEKIDRMQEHVGQGVDWVGGQVTGKAPEKFRSDIDADNRKFVEFMTPRREGQTEEQYQASVDQSEESMNRAVNGFMMGGLRGVPKNVPTRVTVRTKVEAPKMGPETAKDIAENQELRPPYIRKATREQVEEAAPRTADGRPIDPNTLKPIDVKPDLGHKPGHEHWREA